MVHTELFELSSLLQKHTSSIFCLTPFPDSLGGKGKGKSHLTPTPLPVTRSSLGEGQILEYVRLNVDRNVFAFVTPSPEASGEGAGDEGLRGGRG